MFAQTQAHKVCQCIGIHPTGCRDPKCSLECHHRWGKKHFAVLSRYFHELPASYHQLYGSLKMPHGSTIEDHNIARLNLQRNLRRWEQQTGDVLRVLLCSHPTNPDEMHYDVVCYTNVSPIKARDAVCSAWIGSTTSLTPIRCQDAALRYFCKAVKPKPHEFRFLLVRGHRLQQLYGARSFFRDTSIPKIWAALRKEWFGDEPMETPTYERAMGNARIQCEARNIIKNIIAPERDAVSLHWLSQQSRLRHDMFHFVVGELHDKAGLRRSHEDGAFYFDKSLLGLPLPPVCPNERRAWEQWTGQNADEMIGRFCRAAVLAIVPTRTTNSPCYSWTPSNNNRVSLYSAPPNVPAILRLE